MPIEIYSGIGRFSDDSTAVVLLFETYVRIIRLFYLAYAYGSNYRSGTRISINWCFIFHIPSKIAAANGDHNDAQTNSWPSNRDHANKHCSHIKTTYKVEYCVTVVKLKIKLKKATHLSYTVCLPKNENVIDQTQTQQLTKNIKCEI